MSEFLVFAHLEEGWILSKVSEGAEREGKGREGIMSCYEQGTCTVPGCTNPQMFNGYHQNGRANYKKRCSKHHGEYFAAKKGMTRSEWNREILENVAARQGMTVAEYHKSIHPYHKYRKNYCENAKGKHKGWLGVPCNITEYPEMFLHVDHLDGDHYNNDPDNLMTLCPTCHGVKTWIFGDTQK